ncbi:MAG: GNAT family N-acetyltransferase [Phycisphaerales bacterium]
MRVSVRDITSDDLPTLFRYQSDPESNQLAAVRPRDEQSFNRLWANAFHDPSITARAILADDTLVGHISCFPLDGQPAIGYWIDRDYWGKGIASRALAIFLDLIPTRPLHARAARHNVASLRVLQKCGFVITGYQHSPATDRYLECEETLLVLI